jgi:hypothetical protein
MRALLAFAGLLAVTWLEFQYYPGHSYLQGETQFYVPMLERLDTPGFLSRDLVATNPTFAYTIYDEVTLFLHRAAHLTFERALAGQQLLFRFAAVVGIYLLLRSLGVGTAFALLLTAFTNAVTQLAAPGTYLTNPEPVPGTFAFGLLLLAVGSLADEKPLLGAFAAGLALLYEPVLAAAFWLIVILAMICDRQSRRLLRPTLPVLLVFILLLANLSQLQAGLGSVKDLGSRLSPMMTQLSRMRTPHLWPSLWVGHAIWSYLFLFRAILWADQRIAPTMNRVTRWLTLGMASMGLVGVALSGALLDGFHLEAAAQLSPQRMLVFTVAIASAFSGAAAWQAFRNLRRTECIAWACLVAGITANAPISNSPNSPKPSFAVSDKAVHELAAWAEHDTWGSSMFLFPDAARASYPGMFRALSRRALWSDWQSGVLVNYSDEAGLEWWSRWQQTMAGEYSPARVQTFLPLPIDYFVVEARHKLASVRPAFENSEFVAYDAQDLRNAGTPLTR